MNMHEQLNLLERLTAVDNSGNTAYMQNNITDIRSIIGVVMQFLFEIDKIAQEIELVTSTALGLNETMLSDENREFVKSSINVLNNLIKNTNTKNHG